MVTKGTIMGAFRFLKEKNSNMRIVVVQPEEGSSIPGIRKCSPEFLPEIYEPKRVDEIRYVNAREATDMTHRLARECGIFVGMSSGGAAKVGLDLIQSLPSDLPACVV